MAALVSSAWGHSRQRLSGAPCSPSVAVRAKRLVGRDLPGSGDPLTVLAFNLMGDGLRDALDPN